MSDFLSHLTGVTDRGNNSYLACCPNHGDKHPSLSVKICPDDTILVKCFAGCSAQEIVESVGLTLSDLFPKNLNRDDYRKPERPRHNYRDLLFSIARDATFIYLAADALGKGESLSAHDQKRLLEVTARINQVAEVARNG